MLVWQVFTLNKSQIKLLNIYIYIYIYTHMFRFVLIILHNMTNIVNNQIVLEVGSSCVAPVSSSCVDPIQLTRLRQGKYIYIYIYIYIYGKPPFKKLTCFILKTTLPPLNQEYVCKTHHRSADTKRRETTKTQKTTKT